MLDSETPRSFRKLAKRLMSSDDGEIESAWGGRAVGRSLSSVLFAYYSAHKPDKVDDIPSMVERFGARRARCSLRLRKNTQSELLRANPGPDEVRPCQR